MSYGDALQDVLTRGPTPAASDAALATLLELVRDGDFVAARALAAALAIGLGYDDAALTIRQSASLADFLDADTIPPLLRIYLIGMSPRRFLDESGSVKAIAEEIRATDDFRRFQRLVRRNDPMQHEGLKAYALTAFAMLRNLGNNGLLSPAGALRVLDQIIAGSRVEPGEAVDMSFSFGRDKILAITGAGILSILLHELGHHVFDLALGSRGFPDKEADGDANPDKGEPTPAVLAELAAALPDLIGRAQEAQQSSPQRVALTGGLQLLSSIAVFPAGSYAHMSLTDGGGPIARATAADHALLILVLIGADPDQAVVAMSPRGVFHLGVRRCGLDFSGLEQRLMALDLAALLTGLRERSAAWLDRLTSTRRFTSDSATIPAELGLVPAQPRYYPADSGVWEDLAICQQLRAGQPVVSREGFARAVSGATAAGDNDLLRALLEGGGSEILNGCEGIARAGGSLGTIDDGAGTKNYVGPTPEEILAVIETLRDHGGDLNCPIDEGGTTLLIAAVRRAPQSAGALLALGADANRADSGNETPLHAAAQCGWSALVQELLAAGAVVDARNAKGATALMSAAQQDDAPVVEVLLANGANPNAADQEGATALMGVSTAALAQRLIHSGADLNARDHSGDTALMYAAGRGLPAVVRALLDAGADPDAATDQGETALHRAAMVYDTVAQQECFAALLGAGANVDEETSEGITPLMIAAHAGLPSGLRCLLDKGASVNARTLAGQTAVMLACDPANQRSRSFDRGERIEEAVRVLAAARADLDAADHNGATALHYATKFVGPGLAKILLELGASPNVLTSTGMTPLISAAVAKQADMVGALIAAGADVNAHDQDGNTALVLAIRGGASQHGQDEDLATIVQELLDHGADPSHVNAAGESAATLAVRSPVPDRVRALILAASPIPDRRL